MMKNDARARSAKGCLNLRECASRERHPNRIAFSLKLKALTRSGVDVREKVEGRLVMDSRRCRRLDETPPGRESAPFLRHSRGRRVVRRRNTDELIPGRLNESARKRASRTGNSAAINYRKRGRLMNAARRESRAQTSIAAARACASACVYGGEQFNRSARVCERGISEKRKTTKLS